MKNDNISIIHNKESNRFELTVDRHQVVLNQMPRGEIIIYTHTGVPPAIGGQGLGRKLVKTGLDYAMENKLKVRSLRWFVSKYIQLHTEYQDLVKNQVQNRNLFTISASSLYSEYP